MSYSGSVWNFAFGNRMAHAAERKKTSAITSNDSTKSPIESLSDREATTAGNNATATRADISEMQAYTIYLEDTLEKFLSTIEGAGKVKVMITLESSKETIVEKDKTTVRAGSTEVDAAGGSRNTSDISDSEETLYIGGAGDHDTPYVKKIIAPRIAGVVVSSEGGNNPQIVVNITEAIQVLFGIDAHKIKIVKMISE